MSTFLVKKLNINKLFI